MIRLFTAIELVDSVKDYILTFLGGLRGAKWVSRDNIHLTLQFIGEVNSHQYRLITEKLLEVDEGPFSIKITGPGIFKSGKQVRTLWLGIEENPRLLELHRKVQAKLQEVEIPFETRKYTPHITLARLKDTPFNEVAKYLENNSTLDFQEMEVDEFQLFSSKLTTSKAIHQVEQRYKLRK